ncbi:hypothetical protein [Kribbella kalugense]|uniref:HEPN AbiU2-like domain-containing protein n=1 Tax=Kribbella kalugense TaxID=2512221 RepID=A0A4R7ZVM0_9ACTN|nr:hypothetical protein [Kribbella kalugense]TDW22123.1 hypothetical protein EV650_0956 [Kribbella kalugense]
MKLSNFASEFDPADVPTIVGDPMINDPLKVGVEALGTAHRVDRSLLNLLTDAVHGYYFAKQACLTLRAAALTQEGHLRRGTETVVQSLLRSAVIGIATTIDLTGHGRTASIPHALEVLGEVLRRKIAQNPDDDAQAALELLGHIRLTTNVDTVLSLKYVRHLRNKWAGHASLDRSIDPWAGADTHVNLPLLEDALARMVNAFQDLAVLVPMSIDLKDIEQEGNPPRVLADGAVEIEMKLGWAGANALSRAMRELAKEAAVAFVEKVS